MKTLPWGSFPRWWPQPLLATQFRGGAHMGESMAALRVYLTIAACHSHGKASIPLTWSQLEQHTGLSRPMVSKGIRRAQALGILDVNTAGRSHTYTLTDNGAGAFVKLPRQLLLRELRGLPSRSSAGHEALKLYVTLLTVRGRDGWVARIGHSKIVDWTGMQARHVKRAVSMLVAHNLIYVRLAESAIAGHPFNEYHLLGFTMPGKMEVEDVPGLAAAPVQVMPASDPTDTPF